MPRLVRSRRPRRKIIRRRKMAKKRYGSAPRARRQLNANRQDKATIIETQELTVVPEGGNFIGHQLSQYQRALAVSKNYRFYRCKKVELEFIPYANVFAPGQAFPELYFQVDRVQGVAQPGAGNVIPTKNMMLARGTLPVKWTNVVKRSYSPSVLRNENFYQAVLGSDVQAVYATTSTPVLYKWYATQQSYTIQPPGNANSPVAGMYDPTSLRYFGAAYFVDQPLAQPEAVLGTIKMRVHWEFKEPMWLSDTQALPPNHDISGNTV